MDCTDPNAMMAEAKCMTCLTPGQIEMVKTYLLAVIAGGSTDPLVLLQEAKCFACLTPYQMKMIQVYLLCQYTS